MEQQQLFGFIPKTQVKEQEKVKVILNFPIDIFRDDLRDLIFLEDDTGRYRERIMKQIEDYGLKNWFIKKGFPIDPNSIWKNRYTNTETTLIQDLMGLTRQIDRQKPFDDLFQLKGYFLWENYTPTDRKQETEREKYLSVVKSVLTTEEYAKEKAKIVDNKVIVTLEDNYSYDDNYEITKTWFIKFENYGCFGGIHSSAKKDKNEPMSQVWETYKNQLIAEKKEFEVKYSPLSEEKLQQIKKTIEERKKSNNVYLEKEIKEYSEKLKTALTKKYGYEVTIRVLKAESK